MKRGVHHLDDRQVVVSTRQHRDAAGRTGTKHHPDVMSVGDGVEQIETASNIGPATDFDLRQREIGGLRGVGELVPLAQRSDELGSHLQVGGRLGVDRAREPTQRVAPRARRKNPDRSSSQATRPHSEGKLPGRGRDDSFQHQCSLSPSSRQRGRASNRFNEIAGRRIRARQ